ncbi:TatD family hydrolase [Orbus mooreae]|uniref:TatD family hydrolase n=1 Tax=Orbus mooreae TaxID=3074107 RepID=UPI00370D82FB
MKKIIDNHCHFEQLTKAEQQRALADYTVVGVASDYQSCLALIDLQQCSEGLFICLGIHPEHFNHYHELPRVIELIEKHQHQLVGIGEIGLPYFSLCKMASDEHKHILQQGLVIFEQFVQLAAKLNLAVNLHCVGESTWQAIAILQRYQIKRALFHWFAGDSKLVHTIYENGWFISVSPQVNHDAVYQHTVKKMPKEILCLESDGPWCYQDMRGEPAMMKNSALQLAQLFECSTNDIIETSQRNGKALWQIS